jgi:hypothetical protein
MSPDASEFTRIQEAAEAACQKATAERLACCANLADLHCLNVSWCVCSDGRGRWEQWEVWIEEAAPDDTILHSFIRGELEAKGITASVRTEW